MKINFTIPDDPPIDVSIIRDPFFGKFTCKANGETYEIRGLYDLRTHFTFATTHNYRLEVGDDRRHLIEIEHSRPRFVAGFRPQRYIVKVDGVFVADKTGY